jgi:hypothetical protein
LFAEVNDLPSVAAEWNALPAPTRASVALDWDHLLADYLVELEEHRRAGALSAAQAERYEELRHRLQTALPIIRRLGFAPVPVPLGS